MNNQQKHQQRFFFSYTEGLEFQWILNLASFKQLLCCFICLIITKWRKQTLGDGFRLLQLKGLDGSSWPVYSSGTWIVFFVLYSVDNPTEYKSIVLVVYLLIETKLNSLRIPGWKSASQTLWCHVDWALYQFMDLQIKPTWSLFQVNCRQTPSLWQKNKTEAVWSVNIIESTQQELHRHEIQIQENAQLSVWLLQ
jgi:hypothetical protein